MCAPSPFALGSTNWRNARLTREKWRDAALTRTQSLFEGVTALTSITIGTVTSIGIQSFYGCSSLTSFPLASVTKIERVRVISRRPRVDAHTTRKHRLARCTRLASLHARVGDGERFGFRVRRLASKAAPPSSQLSWIR